MASTVIAIGSLNCAEDPTPSSEPAIPEPAKVVTTPVDDIFLILLLYLSATYIFPTPSTSTPAGELNLAAVTDPSAKVPGPANVVT